MTLKDVLMWNHLSHFSLSILTDDEKSKYIGIAELQFYILRSGKPSPPWTRGSTTSCLKLQSPTQKRGPGTGKCGPDWKPSTMEHPEQAPEREEKADLVLALAVTFVGALTACFGEAMATLYCHHSLTHIPAMVRRVPMNISDLSQQGFEALMKHGKNDGALGNKRLRDDHCDVGRNQQMLQTERERKRIKRDEPMPKSRNKKRQLGGIGEMQREAIARVGSAVRTGILPSRSKAETDKRISKQEATLATILEDFQLEEGRDMESPLQEGDPSAQQDPLVDPFAPLLKSGLPAPLSAAATASAGNTTPRPRAVDLPSLADTGSGRGMTRLSVAASTTTSAGSEASAAAGRGAAAAGPAGRGAAAAGAAGRGAAAAGTAGRGAAAAGPMAGRGGPSGGRGRGGPGRRGRRGGVPACARML
jgi:hypothetical protein